MKTSSFIPKPSSFQSPFAFPNTAAFGKVLPKNKIYEHASPATGIKTLFVKEVDKIIWSYKLSPETINLPAKGNVEEIEVFTISLKTGLLKDEVLSAIDKAIPSPILFILSYDNKSRYVAAYKRQSEADKHKWVVSSYFETQWIPDSAGRVPLPVVLDLRALYHSILKTIISLSARQNEKFSDFINRAEKLKMKEREAAKVEARLIKEKQFNRKVEINAELRYIRSEIEKIKDEGGRVRDEG